MYRELLIFPEGLKGKPVYPDTARSLCAKACDGVEIDPAIFARQPDGLSIQRVFGHTADKEGFGAVPSICFGGGAGFIRMTGLGQTGTDLILKNAGKIATAVSGLLGDCPYRVDLRKGDCKVQPSTGAHPYRIRNLIVSKKRDHFAGIATSGLPTLAQMEPLIKKAIYRGLVGQALTLDREIGSHFGEVIGTEECLDIQIFEGKPFFAPIKEGLKTCALGVHGLTFTMSCRLVGPWYTGHLRSRGFGFIEGGLRGGHQ